MTEVANNYGQALYDLARDEQLAEREMNNHLEIVRRYSVKYPEN